MLIRFWGVRGSIPVPGLKTARYGGNTPCVEVVLDDGTLIIIDGGSGIRWLGKELLRQRAFAQGRGKAFMLFSHKHWDHIQGLPYFEPAYVGGNHFKVFSSIPGRVTLKRVFASQHDVVYFPVPFDQIESAFNFEEAAPGDKFSISNATVEVLRLNHPGRTLGFVIRDKGKALAYLCDTAPWDDVLLGEGMGKGGQGEKEKRRYKEKTIQVIKEADVMIYDTFFEPRFYETRKDWGHSIPDHGMDLALAAGVAQLVLFHYAPDTTDDIQDQIFLSCRKKYSEKSVIISCAFEGRVIEL